MKVYTVRKNDTPQKIAEGFTGNWARFGELIRANPQLRTKIVGRDMQTGNMIVTFLDSDFRERTRLRIPDGWVRSGAGSVGYTGGPCDIGGDCDAGEVCDMGTHTCRSAGSGETPTGGGGEGGGGSFGKLGEGMPGSGCNTSADCLGGLGQCVNGICQNTPAQGGCMPNGAACDANHVCCTGSECAGGICKVIGGGGGGPLPKKKEGEACTGSDECEAGLECINGKCAKELQPAPKSSNLIWWILGGLGAGAAIVGMAYAGGAFDDKAREKKAAAA